MLSKSLGEFSLLFEVYIHYYLGKGTKYINPYLFGIGQSRLAETFLHGKIIPVVGILRIFYKSEPALKIGSWLWKKITDQTNNILS